jgi:polyisoprenoid-binding protein YceI
MKTRMIIGAVVIGSLLAISAGFARQDGRPAPSSSQAPGGAVFTIDPVHSSLVFKIQHMGVANFYGRFNEMSGTYNPEVNGSFNIQVKTASVDTRIPKRDDHLRSPDFFNVNEFPTIEFKSTKVEKAGENKLRVTGDLTFHGETKPITVHMTVFPAKDTQQGFKGGVETTFTIKRTDFGMDTYVANGALGDEVQITVAIEGAKK